MSHPVLKVLISVFIMSPSHKRQILSPIYTSFINSSNSSSLSHPPPPHNLLLLLLILLRHLPQNILQLVLRYFLPYLPRARKHDEFILNVRRATLFDEANTAETVGGVGREDLREDRGALVGCGVSDWSHGVEVGSFGHM
jgi:hypothetical protein